MQRKETRSDVSFCCRMEGGRAEEDHEERLQEKDGCSWLDGGERSTQIKAQIQVITYNIHLKSICGNILGEFVLILK